MGGVKLLPTPADRSRAWVQGEPSLREDHVEEGLCKHLLRKISKGGSEVGGRCQVTLFRVKKE